MNRKSHTILALMVLACGMMGMVDAVLRPGYLIKSAIKISLFLLLPLWYVRREKDRVLLASLRPTKRGLLGALIAGVGIYGFLVGSYLALRTLVDFSAVTAALGTDVGVNPSNFVWVALYISFVNSLLEEFFFRGFGFLTLKAVSTRRTAYVGSSLAFALYHVAMMIGWFDVKLIILAVVGLFAGGLLFDWCNEKSGTIYRSWLIHMFANFAINTVGFILFGMLA